MKESRERRRELGKLCVKEMQLIGIIYSPPFLIMTYKNSSSVARLPGGGRLRGDGHSSSTCAVSMSLAVRARSRPSGEEHVTFPVSPSGCHSLRIGVLEQAPPGVDL